MFHGSIVLARRGRRPRRAPRPRARSVTSRYPRTNRSGVGPGTGRPPATEPVDLGEVAQPQPQHHPVLEHHRLDRALLGPSGHGTSALLGDHVEPLAADVVLAHHTGGRIAEVLELAQLGVDLAEGGRPVEESQAPVGPLLQVVARQLRAEGEQTENRPTGGTQVRQGGVLGSRGLRLSGPQRASARKKVLIGHGSARTIPDR